MTSAADRRHEGRRGLRRSAGRAVRRIDPADPALARGPPAAGSAGCSSCPPSSCTGSSCWCRCHDRPVLHARWNGIGPRDVDRPRQLPDRPDGPATSFGIILNAFKLILFFSVIPVGLGLLVASSSGGSRPGALAPSSRTCCSCPRSSRSSPRASCGAGCFVHGSSTSSSTRSASVAHPHLARGLRLGAACRRGHRRLGPLGLCTVLLLTGMSRSTWRSTSPRGSTAQPWQEFRSITVPSLRDEIGVCITVTVIAALAAFDIVYISTVAARQPRRCRASRSTGSRSTGGRSASPRRSRSCCLPRARHRPAHPAPDARTSDDDRRPDAGRTGRPLLSC